MGEGSGDQMRLVHTVGSNVVLERGKTTLFEYVYVPDTPALESPKPYLHPVRTLAGNGVTLFRPHDHVWHKGMAMTWAQLSGQNFWGGPTYVRDKGYVQLPNNGRMEHRGWEAVECDGAQATLRERLAWITSEEETWVDERREMAVADVRPDEGSWALDFTMVLENVRGQELRFGSPTTEGRPLAGYGGLFWRGPRSFLNGAILAGGGLSGPEVMGQRAPWLAYVGKHDGNGASSTVLFIDGAQNPRHPVQWFVRNTPYACASFAFAFDEELTLPAGEAWTLRYRIVIADGAWSAEQADECAREWLKEGKKSA